MNREMMNKEGWSMHKKMLGMKMLLLGALILVNIYFIGLNWPMFIGIVLIGAGLWSLIMPCCGQKRRRR